MEQQRRTSPLTAWLLVIISAIGSISLAYLRQSGPRRRRAEKEAAVADSQRMVEELGHPDGAVRHAPPSIERGSYVWTRQEYSRPGAFDDTLQWYTERAPQKGWTPEGSGKWTQGEWKLRITRTRNFERELPPEHRYEVEVSRSFFPH
jgi:hypothetical protein